VFEEYKDLDFGTFTSLIMSFVGYDQNVFSEVLNEGESHFAKRLITGLAAEHYFESVRSSLPEFEGCALENTTRHGCGYDFRLRHGASADFLAVEVKGLRERRGSLSLTPKEYEAAAVLKKRFYLFVVKNFQETPFHEIFQDPLSSRLRFQQQQRVVVHVSWLTSV